VLFAGGGALLLLGVRGGYAAAGAGLALLLLSLIRGARLSDETATG
jgi:hypothetical protein